MIKVTVFTPTYNRRHTLERTYLSLKTQTFKAFEWVVVDDGSTDDTESLVAGWQKENDLFSIRYHWKPNGGKHTAHNWGVSLARGEYFAILDSDDWYAPDALMVLTSHWESMPAAIKRQFSNIEGICRYENDNMICGAYPLDIFDSDNFSIQGVMRRPMDTMGMYRLAVLKEYPFPDNFDGSFVIESLVWNRIAEKYRTRFINTTIGFKEYQPGGLTKRSMAERFHRSEPFVLYCRELSRMRSVGHVQKMRCRINVYRYVFHNGLSVLDELRKETSAAAGIPFAIAGYLVHLKDKAAMFKEKVSMTNIQDPRHRV